MSLSYDIVFYYTEQKCIQENQRNSKICNPDCKIVS